MTTLEQLQPISTVDQSVANTVDQSVANTVDQSVANTVDQSVASIVDLPVVASTVERLRAGVTFVDLIQDKIEIRAASLAAIIEHLAGDGLKLVWTGNPLRSPLTIERLILQAAGPEADLRFERTPEQLAGMLTLSPGAETGRLVIVQQPETLDPVARETLARMEPYLADTSPRVQILFCGTSAFHPIDRIAPPSAKIAVDRPDPEPPPASRREALPLLLLLVATAMGSFWVTPTARSPDTARAAAQPSQPPSQPAAQPPAQSSLDLAALRRDFDQFLAEQPNRVSSLTPDQRNALFDEYLRRVRKAPPSTLVVPPGNNQDGKNQDGKNADGKQPG